MVVLCQLGCTAEQAPVRYHTASGTHNEWQEAGSGDRHSTLVATKTKLRCSSCGKELINCQLFASTAVTILPIPTVLLPLPIFYSMQTKHISSFCRCARSTLDFSVCFDASVPSNRVVFQVQHHSSRPAESTITVKPASPMSNAYTRYAKQWWNTCRLAKTAKKNLFKSLF